MTRLVLVCILVALLVAPVVAQDSVEARAPMISAQSAILMDRQTGLVLWEYNADQVLPMASTTKIMTAMVILDHGADRLNDTLTVSAHAFATGGSSILAAGDTLTLGDTLKAALICSSNEATVAAAEFLTNGDVPQFLRWMNDKARDLGCTHTRFVNTHGLYDPGCGAQHHTTARELALISRYALTYYPEINRIIRQGVRKPVSINVVPRGNVVLWGRNRIIGQPVPGVQESIVDGVKTGYVKESGKCLVSSATLRGWQLIAVVLNSPDMFKENQAMLRHGFLKFAWKTCATPASTFTVPVKHGKVKSLTVRPQTVLGAPMLRAMQGEEPDDRVVFRDTQVTAPIAAGQAVGTLDLLRDGMLIASTPALAHEAVPLVWYRVKALWAALGVSLTICIAGFVLLYGTRAKNARRRRGVFSTSRGDAHY
jgi:D-alanyl-D-alanine carboxypeptidase (penicillin-binding protein 5/6)